MKVLIRCDGDNQIGTGHVMRCLGLAQALRDNGDEAVFITCSLAEGLNRRLHKEGFAVLSINARRGSKADAICVANTAKHINCDWIIADGYVFHQPYQKLIKQNGLKLLCIDDLAKDVFVCDIVLNQNPGLKPRDYPAGKDTRLLLGTKFVLLRREFRKLALAKRRSRHAKKSLLITMGGSDPLNFTKRILEALPEIKGLQVTVLLGSANRHKGSFKGKRFKEVEIVQDVQDVTRYMMQATLAVHAAGTTSWELAFLGIPSICFVLADNQRPIAKELERCGFSHSLGWYKDFSPRLFRKELFSLLNDPALLMKMSLAGRRLVDGKGAERVIKELTI